MKSLFIIFLFLFNAGFSQEIEEILKSRQFVLEASKITDNEGLVNPANKKLCFVLLDSSKIVVQWIANCDNNGLGGITMKGEVISFDLKKEQIDKESQYTVMINCLMDQGRVKSDLKIEIYSKSHANAVLHNNTSSHFVPKEMKILGKIVPIQSSNVLVGSY